MMRKKVIVLLLSLVLAAAVCFAAGQQEGAGVPAEKVPLIAFSVSTTGNPFYATMAQGVRDEAKEFGYEVLILDAQNKIEKQLSDVEDEVNGIFTYDRRVCKLSKPLM